MAYNRRNLLIKILEIQAIAQKGFARGIPYTVIYRTQIKEQYRISYSTYNNYLSCNAKKELSELNKANEIDTQKEP